MCGASVGKGVQLRVWIGIEPTRDSNIHGKASASIQALESGMAGLMRCASSVGWGGFSHKKRDPGPQGFYGLLTVFVVAFTIVLVTG